MVLSNLPIPIPFTALSPTPPFILAGRDRTRRHDSGGQVPGVLRYGFLRR